MITLDNVTKYYETSKGKHYIFKDVNFVIPDNVSVGIIGRNGAGKSTLIRLLGGIDIPNIGSIYTNNKSISWPVGLAGGFQTSLSAKENITFVCQIHGRNYDETQQCIDYVRDFAEIGNHFDLPMRTYSSGMRSRVAFGLSMAFEFDYYLVDEVMAVGDQYFRSKSQEVFNQRREVSQLILVSHNFTTLIKMCDSLIILADGKLKFFDDVRKGLKAYEELEE